MASRLTVAMAVGAVVCVALVGCGEDEAQSGPDSPSRYVSAVEALLDPPAQIAASISERWRHPEARAPGADRLDRLVSEAGERLAALRALRLEDAGLRRSRDRLATAYAAVVPRMRTAADALTSGDRAALLAAADPFLDSLRSLPSAAASSSSR